jgi:hypothetical protein
MLSLRHLRGFAPRPSAVASSPLPAGRPLLPGLLFPSEVPRAVDLPRSAAPCELRGEPRVHKQLRSVTAATETGEGQVDAGSPIPEGWRAKARARGVSHGAERRCLEPGAARRPGCVLDRSSCTPAHCRADGCFPVRRNPSRGSQDRRASSPVRRPESLFGAEVRVSRRFGRGPRTSMGFFDVKDRCPSDQPRSTRRSSRLES